MDGVETSATTGAGLDEPRHQRSRRPFLILAIVLIGLMAGGLVYWLHARHFATTNDAEIDGPIHRIASRISGQVTAVLVHQNEHVAKGAILVELDAGTEQVAVDRAKAQQAQQAATVGTRQADVAEAQANVEVAAANLYQAQRNETRYTRVNRQAITGTNRDAATANLRAAQARVDVAHQQVASARANLVAAQAGLQAAAVAVEHAKLQRGYTVIRAPTAGFIARRTVRTGNVVSPGQGLMALVGDRFWVTANFKETALGRIHPGQHVRVTLDAIPGISFHARVASIQHGTGSVFSLLPAENATGNYVKIVQRVPVRITFDDPRLSHYTIAPGMSAEPSIRISGH